MRKGIREGARGQEREAGCELLPRLTSLWTRTALFGPDGLLKPQVKRRERKSTGGRFSLRTSGLGSLS